MARYSIEDTTLTALGNAIRNKTGKTMKEELIPIEPYTHHTNTKTDDMSEWVTSSLWKERKTYFPLINGAKQYKVKYSLTKGNSTLDMVTLYFRTSGDKTEGDTIELQAGQNMEAIMTLPSVSVSTIQIYESMYSSIELDLEIIPLNADGSVMENEIKLVVNTMSPQTMAEAIEMMEAGVELPDSAFKISGNCQYRFAYGGWDWFIELFGDKVTTEDVNTGYFMFSDSKVEYIPFDINVSGSNPNLSSMFADCIKLKELPIINVSNKIKVPTSKYNFIKVGKIFNGCSRLQDIPEDYLQTFVEDGYWDAKETYKGDGEGNAFQNCKSLRRVTSNLYKPFRSYGTSYYYSLYYYLFNNCYVIEEVIDLPVEPGPYTSSCFTYTFNSCYRLGRITFATNEDGTPKTANWKNQVIDLSRNACVGRYNAYATDITNYSDGHGITADKEVKDDATYAALKNDPDWFTGNNYYSRYNKVSALETIATLPDVSGSGGTNTIKFDANGGRYTDGGAINTMTEAEIAVATAKGWTVTMA